MSDHIMQYLLADGNIRLFAADSRQTADEARATHALSPTATAAVGRAMTIAGMMACDIKNTGSITLNIRGDGPLGALCVVARPGVEVKAYAQYPQADVPPKYSGKLDVGALVGKGRLSVIRDLDMKEPWVGQVDLHSGEIAEDMTYYFAISEQQPSLVALGVLLDRDTTVRAAGGILAQLMPGCPEQWVAALEQAGAGLTDISRQLQSSASITALVERHFGHMGLVRIGEHPLAYRCDCTQERIERALISLGKEELDEMITQDGAAEVSCHFCNKTYRFTRRQLSGLRDEAAGKEG
ncbi:MAG: Hsp33 family molecular chaperone HslO [Eubacteriales bacterium]|nr:Hsp33 family molecular chaperone HslO [Eubacteriales bacterium]